MIDNNEFNNLGNIWDDGSSPWDTEDLSDLHRLLDDEGEQPFPDVQAVESRSARREAQEPQARSHRAAKAPKEPPKKASSMVSIWRGSKVESQVSTVSQISSGSTGV